MRCVLLVHPHLQMWTRGWVRVEAAVWILATTTVLCVAARSESRRPRSPRAQCPIGFSLTRVAGDAMCYKLKGPEKFNEKFVGCAGNRYASQLLKRAYFPLDKKRLWADYVNLYPGGPFVDWSYRNSTGELLESTYDVKYAPEDVDSILCTVVEPATGNLTAVGCAEKHFRYCFVRPYGDVEQDGCGEGYVRLRSPLASCLQRIAGVPTVGATWRQAKSLCTRRAGRLLQRGWRYSNHPALHAAPSDWVTWMFYGSSMRSAPLGIVITRGAGAKSGLSWADRSEGEGYELPQSEWEFPPSEKLDPDADLVALKGNSWMLVNESYTFYEVICEQPVALPVVRMNLTYTTDDRLQLNVSEADLRDIACFTDSESFSAIERVDLSRIRDSNLGFNLKPKSDGYYWCHIARAPEVLPSRSNKQLFIKDKQSIVNLYAIKIEINTEYNLTGVKQMEEALWNQLSEFIYKGTRYWEDDYGKILRENRNERILAAYEFNISKDAVIHDFKLKRVYLDRRTLLYHAHINFSNTNIRRYVCFRWRHDSLWRDICVIFVEPVYSSGQASTIKYTKYRCVSGYNEDVQLEKMRSRECQRQRLSTQPVDLSSKAQARTEAVTKTELATETTPLPTIPSPPTSPPPPPKQILTDAIKHLELMIQDENAQITLDQMMKTADQVNTLLDLSPETKIPSRLLHLIDEVGARIDLNGSQSKTQVRENIGLVVADSAPGAPIRGLRLAHSDSGELTGEAFHIITGDVKDTHIDLSSSEVVVKLPESLVDAKCRVTFAVFRDNRAFQSDTDHQRVNSRVLSVTVSNFNFHDGDFIDIYMRPLESDLPRDRRRVCAYWHFNVNETGYWSQEGCTLIPSGGANILDVCRCTHLTHFAEILVPRTDFSERDESALEVITIVGCFLSIIGLLLIGLTAAMFSAWRRDFGNKLWLQLSAATLLLAIAFLIAGFSKFDRSSVLCKLSGVVLHYATLVSFCWMLVAAVFSYRRLVLVFTRDPSHKLLRACAFAWGAPCVVVGILLAADHSAYSSRFHEVDNMTGSFCYPTGVALWLTVYSPIAVALLANWTLFALIVCSVFVSRRVQRNGDTGGALRCATVSFLLVFLFGLPWIFGLFSTVPAFAYMFALTATYQGFVLFIFFVVGNKKTRDMWFNQLKVKQLPVTRSTCNGKGGGAGCGGGGGAASSSSSGPDALEEVNAKPRSLGGHDDIARFS